MQTVGAVSVAWLGISPTARGADDAPEYCGTLGTIVQKQNFKLAVWGDPQVAYYKEGVTQDRSFKSKYLEVLPRLREAVALTNKLNPDFTVAVGDIVHGKGEFENYEVFVDACKPLKKQLYLLGGNHDHGTNRFSNKPQGKKPYGNFLWAQQQLGAPELIHYSFDAGDWHFVLFTQPTGGLDRHMVSNPQFLEWLDADLKKNANRPTMFFTHHPPLPVGRRHFDMYGLCATNRGRLVDILTRYGNVKLAFFGHVHNTVASVPLISWRYKGAAWIVLPNASNSVRLDDFKETTKSPWGVGLLNVNGSELDSITFHTLAGEQVVWKMSDFPEYDDGLYAYLKPEWQWPAAKTIRNGGFEKPLEGTWYINHHLPYTDQPAQKRELRPGGVDGGRCLYLYTKAIMGKDSPSYLMSDVRQAVAPPEKNQWPRLRLKYRMNKADFSGPEGCAALVVVSGHSRGNIQSEFSFIYEIGKGLGDTGLKYLMGGGPSATLATDPVFGRWNELLLEIRADFEEHLSGKLKWSDLNLANLNIRLAVYNANYDIGGRPVEIGASFDDVVWETGSTAAKPTAGFGKVQSGQDKKSTRRRGNKNLKR
ncbi:MAG: metallophosphoesterase [Kiritimatiellales bacterium]|nr:metallophosphoesterase [Kiritimatiellales bacterium]